MRRDQAVYQTLRRFGAETLKPLRLETLLFLPHRLNKRDFVDLFQRRHAQPHFIQSGFAQEAHALFTRRAPDLRRRLSGQNHFANAVAQIEQLVYRGSPAESRARALDASRPFIQRNLAPLHRIEAAGFEYIGRVVHFGAARVADQTHQPLRQNAVQRGNEVVRLDAHVQEASNHIDHVVGVDRSEDQVAGQRRLNRDLRRLRIADFANHDLVGIVSQNGSQPAGKGQPLFLVHRNLRNAAQLVLDRIFNGDDLVFVGLDLVDRGVESSRLAAARRPRHQHHAVRLFDVAPEAEQVILIKPNYFQSQRAELLAHRLFIEHAQHGVFAVNRRHDRDAEVDGAPVVLHAEAAVLGHAALGDIELAHDLDTRDHGRVMLFADRRHSLRQHAVDTELDHDRIVARFDVNVGSAPLQCGKNRGIDQADDRAGVGSRSGQLVDAERFFRARLLVFADDLEAFAGFFQHALRLLGLRQNVGDLFERRDLGDDALLQQQADLVDHHQLAGIGDGDGQLAVRSFFQRHEVVAEHQLDRDLFEQVVMQLEIRKIDKFAAVAPRNILRPLQIGERIAGRRQQLPAVAAYKNRFLISRRHLLKPSKTLVITNRR